jgi:glycosyltransferase involved in cell wall biosynthesis
VLIFSIASIADRPVLVVCRREKTPMHVALVTTEFVSDHSYDGGLANYTYRAARSLSQTGINVTVVYLNNKRRWGYSTYAGLKVFYAAPLKSGAIKLLSFLFRILSTLSCSNSIAAELKRLLWFLSAAYGTRRAIAEINSLHPLSLVQYTHLCGIGALHDSRIPSLVRLSSYRDLWIPHEFPYSSPSERLMEDIALKRADSLMAPSKFVAAYVSRKLCREVDVLPSPYFDDISGVSGQSPFELESVHPPYGLYFGSLCSWKGVGTLADALNIFFSINTTHRFVFIGRSYGPIHGVEARAYVMSRLSLHHSRVVLLDAMRHDELYTQIDRADFVCLPTLADNFPNTILESMALKKCIISTRGRGVDEQLTDGENGFLVEPGDVKGLASAMVTVSMMSDSAKHSVGVKAWESLKRFSPEQCGRQLVKKYETIIAERKC